MRVTLEVMTGLLMGRRFDLRPGVPAVFGRSAKATVCFAHDPEMADRHFEVECTADACLLRSLSPDVPTYVNGEQVAEASIAKGARISAGRTTLFVVKVEESPGAPGRPPEPAASESAPTSSASAAPKPPSPERSGPEFLAWLNLDEDAQALVQPGQKGPELIQSLVDAGNYPAAARVQAHLLGARKAVWWGILSVRDYLGGDLPPKEQKCIEAAERWVAEPSDDARRAAGAVAEEVEHEGIAVWVALGAFWAEGSLAPPEFPAVPPDERLAGQGVTAALMIAASRDPSRTKKAWKGWLGSAKDVANGKIPFPAARAAPRR